MASCGCILVSWGIWGEIHRESMHMLQGVTPALLTPELQPAPEGEAIPASREESLPAPSWEDHSPSLLKIPFASLIP